MSEEMISPAFDAFAIAVANSPVGPQPNIAMFFPLILLSSANRAYMELPKGSCIDACSGFRFLSFFQMREAGTAMYSAKHPGMSTPIIFRLLQICGSLFRHW